MAAKTANEFLQAFVVEHDLAKTLMVINPKLESWATTDQLKDLLDKVHPNRDFPTSVRVMEYETIPGQPLIRIYADGRNGEKVIYYTVLMQGTETEGYKPTEVFRKDEPFPSTPLRHSL
jgi:hypothetical protein